MRCKSSLGMSSSSFTRAGTLNVDSREHALVHKLAVQDDFHVAGALELFEDDLVHARAGIDQRGGDDGERATLFNVAGRAEEAFGALQGVGVDAARQHLARWRHDGVVGPRQAGNRV